MTQPSKYRMTLLAAVAGLVLIPFWLSAEPMEGRDDGVVAKVVSQLLEEGHVTKPKFNEEISKRLFQRFLKDLDPGKLYFLKSDIDEFKEQETKLGEQLLKGDVNFAYKVYGRFLERVAERLKLVDELADAKYDFSVKEYMNTDYAKTEYAKNDKELRERWRKRIKFDLLLERLGTKPPPEAEARKKIHDRYHSFARRMKQLDNYDLMEIYLTDLCASLDPHGAYMSPNSVEDFKIAMQLQLEGIGALLKEENGQIMLVETVPGGAAAKDGRLKPNDKIIAVAQGDGKFVDVAGMKLRKAVKLIRGKKGTKVELKIVPVGKIEPVVYSLTRQRIEIKSQAARYEIIEDGKKANGEPDKIGIIDLPSFYGEPPGRDAGAIKGASEDVRRILNELKAKSVDGVILDLRRNPGGLLFEAVALAGLFIDQGPIVQVKDQESGIRQRNDPEKGVVYDGPLMVLVSRGSASASEIVAGALQDYGRALVVGDSATHGKGTVQTVEDLARLLKLPRAKLGALRLTFQQFYRVNGDSTQNKGVHSDIVLPSLTEYLATPEKDMDYALPFDRINPANYEKVNRVPAEIVAVLKSRSAQRVKDSKDFAKLAKEIERVKAIKARKQVPLSEKELKEQMTKAEADKLDKAGDDEPKDNGVYKFKRNFTNNEILKIMEDFLQGKKLLQSRRELPRQAPVRTLAALDQPPILIAVRFGRSMRF
jgi:carboxyl-terminal processing protease